MKKIIFEEFRGETTEILQMKKTEKEVILYKNRKSVIATLLRGKIKIHVDKDTFDLLEKIGEKITLHVDHDEHDVLTIYVIPEAEMKGEKRFVKNKKGKWTINLNGCIDKKEVQEVIEHEKPESYTIWRS